MKIVGTRITIDLGELSWTRFLIAEYVFNPPNPIFESYFKRGMSRPADIKIGERIFYGMTALADSIIEAVEKCPVELQPHLYSQIILSGGNMSWIPPPELREVAVDAPTRMKYDLAKKGVENHNVRLSEDPQYTVWRGCIVYGYAVPADYSWSWETMEGWMRFKD